MPAHFGNYIVLLAVLGLVIWRNRRGRRLRVEVLWIMPVAMAFLAGVALSAEPPPSPPLIAGLAVSLIVGAAVGWQRGRLTRIVLDPATRSFTSQASVAGLIFIAVLFFARFALRAYVAQTARNPALTVAVTDGLLLFAVGLVAAQRVEMMLRCRKMLANAEASSATAP